MAQHIKLTDKSTDLVDDVMGADDDAAFLDDPLALALQTGASLAQQAAAKAPPRPAHVSEETHNLVCATMAGGAAYKATRDAELELLRQKRLRELKERKDDLLPTAVDARAMLAAVRDADGATPVVVHVFSDAVAGCKRVDRALGLLAARQLQNPGDCRFRGPAAPKMLRLDAKATRIDPAFGHEIDEEALPCVLVYRARELVKHGMNVAFDGADDVEDWLDED
mmetsp:Transcript_18397/g.54666  ORF Transcript_18397/g.54666 Transcript_18397/m.54666 type:complete len:224 (+) Transcript_18397:194-865(+)